MNLAQISSLKSAFHTCFKSDPEAFFFAPGRVNLIGEHTDYNEGFVLPCAIQFGTYLAVKPRADQHVRLASMSYDQPIISFELTEPIPKSYEAPWSDYVRAVFDVLLKRGIQLKGLDMMLLGDVPQGAGLSSSASLQVVVGLCLATLHQLSMNQTELALLAQEAENQYVGCRCGVMDQLASSASKQAHATLIDCKDLSLKTVHIPENTGLLIVNSNVKRGLVESAYNERRFQCEEAAQLLGVSSLRHVSIDSFENAAHQLPLLTRKRARHVIFENARTLDAVDALSHGDLDHFGQLMRASHHSLDVDFEVTVPQVNYLAELLNQIIGTQGGARMTGGGFGGCVVAIAPLELISELEQAVKTHYEVHTGLKPNMYLCHASAGAHQLKIT